MRHLLLSLLLFFSTPAFSANGGFSPVIWGPNGTAIVLPANGICMGSLAPCVSAGALDPTVSAVSAPEGSLYMSTNGNLYVKEDSGSSTNWTNLNAAAGGGVTLNAFGSIPNNDAASLVGAALTLQPADGTHPGGVSTTTQTFAGVKTFSSAPNLSSLTASEPVFTDSSKNLSSNAITGSGSVVMSASPTLTGTITAAAANFSGALSASNLSGTNTGDQTITLTGDVTGSGTGSFAATVSKIQGTAVSGTSGTTNVVFSSSPTLSNPVVGTQASSDNSTKAASTAYVQTALAQINPAAAVYAASTANIAGTYTNAVGGVCIGDTFTVTATGALSLDGTNPASGARVLLKDQTSTFQNGVWTVTTVGSIGVNPVFTRALDFDSSDDINAGNIIPVANGTVNAGSSWYQTAAVSTCNSDAQTWAEFQKAASSYLQATNDLSDVSSKATSFNNLSPLTTLGDVLYGGGSGAGTRLAGNTTSTKNFLVQTGTGSVSAAPTWGTISSGDVPTLNQNTTGTAATFTGSLTGDVTSTAMATTIATNAVTNAKAAQMAANTLKGNNTGSTANAADLTATQVRSLLAIGVASVPTIQIFTSTGTATGHVFTVSSANATIGATYTNNGNTYTVLQTISSGTVLFCSGGSATSGTTLTKSSGTGDSTITYSISQPTATYTTPTSPGPLYLRVRMMGAGGGGAGSSTTAADNGGAGGGGGNTTFGTALLTANGGLGGAEFGGNGGTGGSTTLNSPAIGINLSGGQGTAATGFITVGEFGIGGYGAASPFGGAGGGGGATAAGLSAIANTGSGGGGAGSPNSPGRGGSGGGAGGYIDALIPSPSASYSYAIGAAGVAGAAGTSGSVGGAGGSGLIEVTEYYQ